MTRQEHTRSTLIGIALGIIAGLLLGWLAMTTS